MSHVLIDLPARLLLSPLLLVQALQVRNRALRLPEAAGPRQGATGRGPPLRLLILGDSSAAGVGVAHQDQALAGQLVALLAARHHVTWRLEARTGATTRATLDRLVGLGPHRFDVAVVALGVNDVTHAVPLRIWLRRQHDLVRRLTTEFGVQRIYLSGLPPMGRFPALPDPLRWVVGRQSSRFDRALRRRMADHPHVTISTLAFDLDASHMAEDGFHPGPRVYAAWADDLAGRITGQAP